MLYHFLYPLRDHYVGFGVFQYITFRTFMAIFTALAVYLVFGRPMIRWLTRRQFWQTVRDDGPATHLKKAGTPTMGGLLIWLAVGVSLGLWGRWDNGYVLFTVAVGFAYGMIGFFDDYRKLILRDPKGLQARYKFPLQMVAAALAVLILFDVVGFDRHLAIPFFKVLAPDLHWWYVLFGTIVIAGAANAVNLTDGLDGLVAGPGIMSYLAYGIFAYAVGHATIAGYLQIPFAPTTAGPTGIPGVGELTVLCGAVVGGLIGFLWFNAHPAEIFMGDVGSLPLGAMLGAIALLTKQELLLVVVGGIFVLETISVMVQVASFKLTRRRVFRMAPLHHHFELKGWPESRVIVRFWIVALVLALVSLTTLKIR
ncbi:MAG: phospho-N-acetylmuramoyl-pentapeptide-transferase [Deltaproteobacteria bacterium]|nr:phospho-N-acetylmuramoyl-pentapeptide-transferase [Deltaproteobacteria bacterium]